MPAAVDAIIFPDMPLCFADGARAALTDAAC